MKELTVLLVEDNDADIILTSEMLSEIGIEENLHIAKDGQEALDFLHRKSPYQLTDKPDLVILDINLPKLNGKEVLGLMKGDKDLAAIPVIMYTSSHHENDKVECYKKKADLYLTKFNSFQEFQKTKDSFKSFLESKFN